MEAIITAKPTILIYHHKGVTPDSIKELLYGIEEEGIPYTLEERPDEDGLVLADLASHASALSVGLSCTKDMVILSFKIYRRNFSCISCAIIGKSPDHYE